MTVPTKRWLWHLCRLALAATLLWLDLRLFLFYAFTILLQVLHRIDRLRAIMRVYQLRNESMDDALAESVGTSREKGRQHYRRLYDSLDPQVREDLDDDARKALSGDLL